MVQDGAKRFDRDVEFQRDIFVTISEYKYEFLVVRRLITRSWKEKYDFKNVQIM